MMYKWLPLNSSANIPPFAHTMVRRHYNLNLIIIHISYDINSIDWSRGFGGERSKANTHHQRKECNCTRSVEASGWIC